MFFKPTAFYDEYGGAKMFHLEIKKLLQKFPKLGIIEVWDKVLFFRMKKGRNLFQSKNMSPFSAFAPGTSFLAVDSHKKKQIEKHYKSMLLRLHPDKSKSKNAHQNFLNIKKIFKYHEDLTWAFYDVVSGIRHEDICGRSRFPYYKKDLPIEPFSYFKIGWDYVNDCFRG